MKPLPCESTPSREITFDPDRELELSVMARALGHPVRIRILRFLLQQQSCFAGDIVELLPLTASTVSQHLKQLKEAGLITGEIDGPRRCYCVNPDAMRRFQELFSCLLA